MANSEKKQYFIKDVSVDGLDNDLFNYADMSKVLERILDSNEPPYNIAVIGKWGLGKSSLINLVKNKLTNDKTYNIQEINAWKYEKDSLRRVFLKQIWQGVSGERLKSFQEIQRSFSELINNAISPKKIGKQEKISTKEIIKKYAIPTMVIFMITVLGFIFYKLVQANTYGVDWLNFAFWKRAFLSYCNNIATTLLLPVLIMLLTALHSDYRKKETNKFEFNFPLETADDYELFLENAIAEKLKSQPDLKIVTIIDDLDRLSIDKIVEALDSIKAFVTLPNCIFIVPFDDEIIKAALEKRKETGYGAGCDIIESELILDKLFQFKVYLPPLLRYDINKYAMDIIKKEMPDFLKDYIFEDTMQRLINKIIIHSDVTTPRQVKKLVNAFVNNYLLANEREESGRVEKKLLTSDIGIEQIAKLSVLQADFNQFYDLLFKDITYISRFVEIVNGNTDEIDVPEALHCYYIYSQGTESEPAKVRDVTKDREPLLNYLNRTAKYSVKNLAPFLYLAQDEISIKTGDEQQQRVIAALESGTSATLKNLITEKPESTEAIIAFLKDTDELELPLSAALECVEYASSDYKAALANVIVDRMIEPRFSFDDFNNQISPKSLLSAANESNNDKNARSLIEKYTEFANKRMNISDILPVLEVFVAEYNNLSDKARDSIKSIANKSCDRDLDMTNAICDFIDYNDSNSFMDLWGMTWYERVCLHICDNDDFSDEIVNALKNSFNLLYNDNPETVIENIVPLFSYPALLQHLSEILSPEICNNIDVDVATEIVEKIIVFDYNENEKMIHALLPNLHYEVNEENAKSMVKFTENYKSHPSIDNVLVYMGENNFFPLIKITISNIIKDVFVNEKKDELFQKINSYFDEKSMAELFTTLTSKVSYANKDYKRELAILSTISNNPNCNAQCDAMVKNSLLLQLHAYYNQQPFYKFVAHAIGILKDRIEQSTLDTYVDSICQTYINNQRTISLEALKQISGSISEEKFKKVFPIITKNFSDTDFDIALSICDLNEDNRPKDSSSQIAYKGFLVSHIKTAINPNKVLQIISNSCDIPININEIVVYANGNSNIDKAFLQNLIVTFYDRYTDADGVAKEALSMFSQSSTAEMAVVALKKIIKVSIDDVMIRLSDGVKDTTGIDTLTNIAKMTTTFNSNASISLYSKCLTLSFRHDNIADKVGDIVSCLSEFDVDIRTKARETLETTLITGFSNTTSITIQRVIVSVIKQCKWTRKFKNKLLPEKVDVFNKYSK
jgi:hypothetical protein